MKNLYFNDFEDLAGAIADRFDRLDNESDQEDFESLLEQARSNANATPVEPPKHFKNKTEQRIYEVENEIKRLTKEKKNYKKGYEYLVKLIEYEEKEKICGKNRNSYFKTDVDATAMVLKEDYYSKLSHDFHDGYNIQVIV